ncbi:MAG: hypothetical protein LBR80_03175 [Deltaproteobacteria bacterium]|jgi:hypothetical protein|nr:hypothetical protein [Deltaproteobacteria bacterium]
MNEVDEFEIPELLDEGHAPKTAAERVTADSVAFERLEYAVKYPLGLRPKIGKLERAPA